MPAGMMASSASWAEETFGKAELGDPRRTARAVKIAGQLAANPGASIPKLAGSRAQAKAVYRFFNMLAATLKGLCTPHWMHTRAQAAAAPVVLMIQDTTTLNFGEAGRRAGTGPISSNGADHGLHLHSVLAVVPATDGGEPQVLGLAHHAVYARTPAPPEETQQQRRGRRRESARWIESMEAIASPLAEAATRWIQVADREADIFEVFARARELRMGCIIRAAGSAAMRGASLGHGHADSKVAFETLVRRLPAEGSLQPLHVRGATSRPA